MNFSEKYQPADSKVLDANKLTVSNGDYAVCESLQELINEIKIAFRKTN